MVMLGNHLGLPTGRINVPKAPTLPSHAGLESYILQGETPRRRQRQHQPNFSDVFELLELCCRERTNNTGLTEAILISQVRC